MALKNVRFNLKLFQIDKFNYEFTGKTNAEIVEIIRRNHKKHLYANEEDMAIVKPSLEKFEDEEFTFYTYCYNQPKDQNYWKLFLPDELVKEQNFDLIEFSFVLFIVYKDAIFCVLGGSGINVIKRYLDNYFGLEFYQHFANPNDDISIAVNTRGVTGNLSQRSSTYNNLQSIKDSLIYSEIPKKLKIIIRDELIKGLFKKYKIDKENALMEIGAYFSLRKKLNFEELKMLVVDICEIMSDKSKYVQLSLFNRIKDQNLIKELDDYLKDKITDDVIIHNTPERLNKINSDIIELVNYKKIEKFYECSQYRLHLRKKRVKNDQIVLGRDDLYLKSTKYIYDNLENVNDRFEIKKKLFELSIIGMIDLKDITFDPFYNHIVAEMPFNSKKYFKIDNQWFHLDDLFIEQIKQEAINNYKLYELKEDILLPWKSGDEDYYNNTHKGLNYYIFDKRIKENIELCDILYLDTNNIYFIHVKNGFDTNMRSLANQVTLSSQRLWNDINNVKGSSYFTETLKYYNKFNPKKKLNSKTIFNEILNGDLKVNFVMAYRNTAYKNNTSTEKIELSKSNIAKFSLVQTVRDIRNFKNFEIHLIDISQIQ
ncbi:DUF6119 family protein [Chryseobacterium sp. FH1]|uniref:DUF6119 family protein n=1 Tax=Chryseobacterium sp. FH1 TaxID=1233951 RepID=UPI0004E3FF9A|nr:DUF6119 family protein [Chryseobacterium sp. FH1]KFC19235.1 hypothetical protein IO90_07925 [Chryseobacterium sp. FH1]